MSLRKAIAVTIGAEVALAAVVAGGITCAARSDASTHHVGHAAVVCARAAFLADDYAHTHTGGRQERRAVKRCAALVGGF
jgi:hypothetical protein